MALFVLVLRDKPLPKTSAPPFKLGAFLAGFWANPVRYPPQVVGTTIAAVVINAFHSYTLLFALAAILASLGVILIQQIKGVR